MPTIKDAKDAQQLLEALVEMATQSDMLRLALENKMKPKSNAKPEEEDDDSDSDDDAIRPERETKPDKNQDKKTEFGLISLKAYDTFCDEITVAEKRVEDLVKSKDDRPTYLELIAQFRATLVQIALSTNCSMDKLIDQERRRCVPDLANMPEYIRAYRADTRDTAWGGDAEARRGAIALGFRCKIFVTSGGRLDLVATVGRQSHLMTQVHLLHRGNHYDVLEWDARHGDQLTEARVIHIPKDGHCLYNALLRVAERSDRFVMDLAALRKAVSKTLTDEEIRISLIAMIADEDFEGLGVELQAAFGSNDPVREDVAEGLSLLFLAYAKTMKANKPQEVQAMDIDGGLMISSNNDAAYDKVKTALENVGNAPGAAAEKLKQLLGSSVETLVDMQECRGGDREKFVKKSLQVLGSAPVIRVVKGGERATEWFPKVDKSKDPDKGREVYVVRNTSNLHAEQFLLLLFAKRLRAKIVPERDVVVRGVKPPCGTCKGVLAAFAAAYRKVYGRSLIYDKDGQGRSDDDKKALSAAELDVQDNNQQNNNQQDKNWTDFLLAFDALMKKKS